MVTKKYAKENEHCKSKKGMRRDAPRLYSKPVVTAICNLIMKGKSTNAICQMKGMPSRVTIGKWILKYPEFKEKFMRAKQIQAYFNADDITDLADNCDTDTPMDVMKAKLQVDTRKWIASKLIPTVYGDKSSLAVEHKPGEVDESRLQEIVGNVVKRLESQKGKSDE